MTATPALSIDDFAERVLFVRTVKLKMHRTQLADRLGVPHATVRTWEEGGRPRDIVDIADRYVRVCADAGLTLNADWLLRGGIQLSSCLTAVTIPEGQMELALGNHRPRVEAV